MWRWLSRCLAVALCAAAGATAIGLLGAWSVIADAFTHLRLHLALAALVLAALMLPLNRRWSAFGLAVALVNIGFVLTFSQAPRAQPGHGPSLKVMTVNVLYPVENDAQIIAQIAAEQPDVVLIQELTRARAGLLEKLRATYPWQVDCSQGWRCDVAIVSRHPWDAAEADPVGPTGTKLAWARFGPQWANLMVASLHLKWPLISNQSAQLASAREFLARHNGPVIVAGDLNAAPWSAAVQSFTRAARLTSAGGFMPTWPRRTTGQGQLCTLCVPQLQIDHILVSHHIGVVDVHRGQDVGSDHLPLLAVLRLPSSVAQAR